MPHASATQNRAFAANEGDSDGGEGATACAACQTSCGVTWRRPCMPMSCITCIAISMNTCTCLWSCHRATVRCLCHSNAALHNALLSALRASPAFVRKGRKGPASMSLGPSMVLHWAIVFPPAPCADELLEAGTPTCRRRPRSGMPRQHCALLPTMLRSAQHAAEAVTSARCGGTLRAPACPGHSFSYLHPSSCPLCVQLDDRVRSL